MSFWNKILAAMALTVVLGAPAFADGTPGQRVNRGPEPVRAHQPVPPEPGCYLIENGQAWSCPARPVAPAPVTRTTGKPCCGTVTRRVVKEHPPVVTQRTVTHRQAPTVTRQTSSTVRRVETSSEVRLDMASFSALRAISVSLFGSIISGIPPRSLNRSFRTGREGSDIGFLKAFLSAYPSPVCENCEP